MRPIYPVIMSMLILCTGAVSAQVYRWVDDNGVVQYSQFPPPGVKAESVRTRGGAEAENEAANERLDAIQKQLDESREARQQKETERQQDKARKEQMKQNCIAARNNHARLQVTSQRVYQEDQGTYARLTEEQRLQRLKEAEDAIKQHCQDP